MRRSIAQALAVASLVMLACAAPLAAQPALAASSPADGATVSPSRLWAARLMTLDPQQPERYVLLAEEVIDAAPTDSAARRLAIDLLVRATAYAAQVGDTRTAHTAALLLAELAATPAQAMAVRDYAQTLADAELDQSTLDDEGLRAVSVESADYRLSFVLAVLRRGEGIIARQKLRQPDVDARLAACHRRLVAEGYDPGAGGIVREAQSWPCSECQNTGVVRRGGSLRICGACDALPGPSLTPRRLAALQRVELELLGFRPQSWSDELAFTGDAPLSATSAGALATMFSVDLGKPRWRADGDSSGWVHPPEATSATPPVAPADAPAPDATEAPSPPAPQPASAMPTTAPS